VGATVVTTGNRVGAVGRAVTGAGVAAVGAVAGAGVTGTVGAVTGATVEEDWAANAAKICWIRF